MPLLFSKFLEKNKNIFLAIEFLLLCVALPTVIIVNRLAPYMLAFLWVAAAYCAYHLWKGSSKNFAKNTWKWHAVNKVNMKKILPRWLLACLGMCLFMHFYDPDKLFIMVHERPLALPMIFLLYPLISALPQELIFCSFFFHRYKPFMDSDVTRIIASAMVFAYAHILYINWVAPLFSFIGGLIFAHTYVKTRSLALVTVEHALYGNAMFLIGMGYYFWAGSPH